MTPNSRKGCWFIEQLSHLTMMFCWWGILQYQRADQCSTILHYTIPGFAETSMQISMDSALAEIPVFHSQLISWYGCCPLNAEKVSLHPQTGSTTVCSSIVPQLSPIKKTPFKPVSALASAPQLYKHSKEYAFDVSPLEYLIAGVRNNFWYPLGF